MELKSFIPDDKFFDDLVSKSEKEYVRTHIEGRNIGQVLVCIIPDNDESILMETMSHLNDFMAIFGEKTEACWGFCHSKEGTPMRFIVAIGKNS